MTVAAVVVSGVRGDGLADAVGRPAARRIVDVAWAGGALPIVVVADDHDGSLAAALAGSPAQLVRVSEGLPLPGVGLGAGLAEDVAVSRLRTGVAAALDAVADTDAVLCWPLAMTWVDPETVTSLIEAHGSRPGHILRPRSAQRLGWPVLVPVSLLEGTWERGALSDGRSGLEAALAAKPDLVVEGLDLGDPGSVHGRDVPLDDLPAYAGPSAPVAGPPPEWGSAAADEPD